ncbi:acyl-CoA dehydrogenase [Streptomyces sp. NPDC051572]|uniref:acyl-CoA dehydrogenase n=1 Tax=unclassified Streptomyces TaxID=2593676 RepID=UPI00344B9117
MALAITDDHQALADVVRSFTSARDLRGLSRAALDGGAAGIPDVWREMADLGWLGLHVPEEFGGSGYGLPELAVVADELGYGVAPGPFLPSVVVSAVFVVAGTETQRKNFLPALTDGSLIAGLGLSGTLTRDAGGRVRGDAGLVLAGLWADTLVLRVGADLVLVRRDATGVSAEPLAGMDPSLGLTYVSLDAVPVPHEAVVPNGGAAAVRLFRTIASAEAAGGSRAALDMAVEYAKVREQFGRTIGTFQAVKHRLSDMLVAAELASALSWDAARADEDDQQGRLAAAAAAVLSFGLFQENAQSNIQTLGGIGFTWEHDAQLYVRRAVALSRLARSLGSPERELYTLAESGVRRRYAVDLPPEAVDHRDRAREFRQRYEATPMGFRREVLAKSGYMVPHWPPPYGRGAGPVEQLVIEEELADMDLPDLGIGTWLLPTLIQTANPEQVRRWVAPSLLGELTWCQLFSEPNAGSDAAAVQTRARRVEGGWRITGQKVWTSAAHRSDLGLATVRTNPDAAKHKGITAMVVDLHAPGVEVRPLREITGDSLFNEVFFDDVFVPDADVVGDVNEGWKVARTTLGNERVTIGGGSDEGVVPAYDLLALVSRYVPDEPVIRHDMAHLIAEEQAMRLINLRQVARAVAHSGPGPEGNVTKLLAAEHAQRSAELAMEISGLAAISGHEPRVTWQYLYTRCLSIAGGTSEITRNVIAERILGLPRDPLIR